MKKSVRPSTRNYAASDPGAAAVASFHSARRKVLPALLSNPIRLTPDMGSFVQGCTQIAKRRKRESDHGVRVFDSLSSTKMKQGPMKGPCQIWSAMCRKHKCRGGQGWPGATVMGMIRAIPGAHPHCVRVALRSKSAILPICQTHYVGSLPLYKPKTQRGPKRDLVEFGAGDGNRTHVISLGS